MPRVYIPPPGNSGAPVHGFRSVTWNTMIKMSPNQKIGMEWPMNATVVTTWSSVEYWRSAEKIPMGTARTSVTRVATPIR